MPAQPRTFSYENMLFKKNPYIPDLKFISKNSSFGLFDIKVEENLPEGKTRLLRTLQEVKNTSSNTNSKVTYSFGALESAGP